MSKTSVFILIFLILASLGATVFLVQQKLAEPVPIPSPTPSLPTPSGVGTPTPTPSVVGATPSPSPKACTMEAKQCPDGSYVGRVGPSCEFAKCPIDPIGRECDGPSDTSCPTDFNCVQGCGPPVAREDDPPPPYFCQLKGYFRPCPICLAEGTLIDTPYGNVAVENLKIGGEIWTMNNSGGRVAANIIETSRTSVSPAHHVIHLVLDDGRELFVSSGHPTADGRRASELSLGDMLDGARVTAAESILYGKSFTYDILPSGDTGTYWANGVLMGSTLFIQK
ncbi:MAG: Hint domain-containing protein [bacterium]|nr:Hint domain-containing protein [bacterium]